MKCANILLLAIMLASASMFGQGLTQPPLNDPSKCPVGLEVEQNGSPVSYGAIAGSRSAHGPAEDVDQRSSQRFDFKMTNFSPLDIVNAEITAHAFSSKWRVFSVPAPTPDLWRTVDVAFDVRGNGNATRELSFAHFPAIRTFDMNSVTYADGSTWHASSPGACSVAPRAAMRITTQAQSGSVSRRPLTSEMNDYTNAVGQTEPPAKEAAINAFLMRYPASSAREDLLEQLMAVYVHESDMKKVAETSTRILSVDPRNLRALFYITYALKEKALASPMESQPLLDDAASAARLALDAPSKPSYMSESEFEKLKTATAPHFYSAIAIDDAAKRDYSGAIDNFTMELSAPVNVRETESGMELDDTYRLAQAYEEQTPADLKNAAWFYTRAAQYSPPKTKPQWEEKAESTYLGYHGSMDGYPEIQALARANLFPPPEYSPSRAIASRKNPKRECRKTLALFSRGFLICPRSI